MLMMLYVISLLKQEKERGNSSGKKRLYNILQIHWLTPFMAADNHCPQICSQKPT